MFLKMEKLEKIIKVKCESCEEVTPHVYKGKDEAQDNYYLYKCLYCENKYRLKLEDGQRKNKL